VFCGSATTITVDSARIGRYIAERLLHDDGLITVENERWRVLRRAEFERFKREDWPTLASRHASWHMWRHKNPRRAGQLAKTIAAGKGKRVGPKPVQLAPSEEDEVRERWKSGQSQQRIASDMSLTRKVVRRVLASPKD
jgi:hypothetical protein